MRKSIGDVQNVKTKVLLANGRVRSGTIEETNKHDYYYHINYHKEKDRCNLLIYNGLILLIVGVRRLELPAPTSRT